MGRIKKAAGAKHEATLPRGLAEFIQTAIKLPIVRLRPKLLELPFHWPFPRGDLYHWIPLLDHFDVILEEFVKEYDLKDGPQTRVFGSTLLQRGLPEANGSATEAEIKELGYGEEADRELIEAVVFFSRLLHENCGNRSLYASSDRLGEILNTSSLSLLCTTLRLAARLAIRYHHSYQRGPNSNAHANAALRASHYNIDLDHVQLVGESLAGGLGPRATLRPQKTAADPQDDEDHALENGSRKKPTSIAASDMLGLAMSGPLKAPENVVFAFPRSTSSDQPAPADSVSADPIDSSPSVRRTNGPPRPARRSTGDGATGPTTPSPNKRDTQAGHNSVSVSLKREEMLNKPTHEIMAEYLPTIPKLNHYEFLSRVRAAKALLSTELDRQLILSARILALTNLAYVYPESLFHQKVLQRDSDEPPQLQIVQQLASLVYPPNTDGVEIPLWLRTIALGGLEAFAKHKSRATEVYAALSVNASHGVLLFILRKTVGELEADGNESMETHEWNEALVSLLDSLTSSASRTAEALVGAGLLEILVDVLKLRSDKAERWHHRVIGVLSLAVNTVRDAFQTFVNCKGLDAVSDLISWEVSSSIERVQNNNGFPEMYKSHVTDYQLPYFQQQTLRWLFKFVNHMMTHNNALFDRVLRNLIDSPPLLKGLRDVLANGDIFGSTIWSGAVNILSSFIHNEPTSYAVIAEAGLSKTLLESVLRRPLPEAAESAESDPSWSVTFTSTDEPEPLHRTVRSGSMGSYQVEKEQDVRISRPAGTVLAKGILPATDAINAIPAAFGAICLNNSGLDMFLSSGSLEVFFEVFESPEHVRSLAAESNLPKVLGQHFDELVRHHPRLKSAVTQAIVLMVARVGHLCNTRDQEEKSGARLWTNDSLPPSSPKAGNDQASSTVNGTASENATGEDVVMDEPPVQTSSDNTADKEEDELKTTTYLGIMARFLSGYFDNHSLCGDFLHSGGLEFLLNIATSPCLPYNFSNVFDSHDLCHVFHLLIEFKPHLVLPAIITRLTSTLEKLEPLMGHHQSTAFFSKFTQIPAGETTIAPPVNEDDSNAIIRAMVSIHLLLNILHDAFLTPVYGSRSSHSLFNQVNLTDSYLKLIKTLGRLYRVCVWEEIQLQNTISDDLKQKTRVNGYGMGSDEADEIFGFRQGEDVEDSQQSQAMEGTETTGQEPSSSKAEGSWSSSGDRTPRKKILQLNVISLRYLLSQIPSSITPFLQGLGRSLVPKRRIDPYQRQNAFMVADALGEVALENLQYDVAAQSKEEKDRFAYWIVAITSLSHLLIEGADGRGAQISCLTLVLHAFKSHGGLDYTNELLREFSKPLYEFQNHEDIPQERKGLYNCLAGGMKLLLMFYGQITSHKVITEAPQSHSLANTERDRESVFYFAPAQLLMGLRLSVLSAVRPIWESSLVDNSASATIKCLIDILKHALQADASPLSPPSAKNSARKGADFKPYTISTEKEASLKARNIPPELAREALYRCMNGREAADEYCDAHDRQVAIPRLPIPDYEATTNDTTGSASLTGPRPQPEESIDESESAAPMDSSAAVAVAAAPEDATIPAVAEATSQSPEASEADVGDGMAMSIDNLLNLRETPAASAEPESGVSTETKPVPMPHRIPEWQNHDQAALQQFEELRTAIRSTLVDKALDILITHDDVTFELADLLLMATTHDSNAATIRNEMGTTLVQSLVSMSADDLRPEGKRIASVANLLAIVIQEKDWFDSISSDLKQHFSSLLGFIRIMPDQKSDEPSPWVSQTLLVLEKLLSEDAQPPQIKWTPPTADNPEPEQPVAEVEEPLVSQQEKEELFKSLMELLPRVGKDQLLALSITRILAILTRDRDIASTLAEKRNIQRLFVMMKQLAGLVTEKFHSTFMLILRHMMEDDETIRRIIKSEIYQAFRNRSRPVDTSVYVRTMHAYVLRSPRIFLEVTNEMLKLQRFDAGQRPQILVMKDAANSGENPPDGWVAYGAGGDQPEQSSVAETASADVAKPSTEDGDADLKLKRTATDSKFPTLDYADGVVHYVLSQLLAYKDIDDREPEQPEQPAETEKSTNDTQEMEVENASGDTSTPPKTGAGDQKPESAEQKVEKHPIYFYRSFLLQCLSELLMSYSRAKIEFINFSRKADPKTNTTPSKPRSVVLNYILHSLVPLNRLDKLETTAFKKSLGTSNWAMSVVVSLCQRTNENASKREVGEEDVDPDLSFVRKFVLEQALKAFKDAQATTEETPVKYAKILSLADLFTRILNGRILPTLPGYTPEAQGHTDKEVAKIMFEKGFISSLTNSIADIDLNVDNARRVVKYVLRPLKTLTQTAVHLSETSDLSASSGPADEDDISTATSVSEEDNGREETPDLFRHSVLATLDPGREEESSSESDDEGDEDMYDDYDDGAEYDEDMPRDDDEVMSDEDDEIDAPGRIEGLPGDVGVAFEVVMGSDGGDDTEDESDPDDSGEDDEDDDDMDNDQDVEIIEEITADDENDSLADDENDWEDEDDEGNPLFTFNQMEAGQGGEGHRRSNIPIHMDIMEADDEAVNSDPASAAHPELHLDDARLADFALAMGPADDEDDEDDVDDDEDPDDMDEDDEEMLYPDYDEEDGELEDSPWGWDAEENVGAHRPVSAARHIFHHPTSRHHHHHHPHHHHPTLDPWSIFTPQFTGAPDRMAAIRPQVHMPRMPHDDNQNPLLQRDTGSEAPTRRGPAVVSRVGSGLRDVFSISANRESPISLLNNMMQAVGAVAGPGIDLSQGAFHLHIGGPGGGMIPFPREIQSLMGARHTAEHMRPAREEPFYLPLFYPMATGTRWSEESRLLYGSGVNEKTQRVINSLLKLLVPPALEEEKVRKEKEAEALRKRREEERAREERLAKERAEQEEKERKEREEQEAKEAAEREAAEREAAEQRARENPEQSQEATPMEGIESTQAADTQVETSAAADVAAAGPSESITEPQERVRATFRGREVDITHLGIDLEYLNALPEELREEVLMQQLAEQRSQQAVSGEQPTEIDREFLDALPPNIREEILAQEAQDRRRREREEARRQANAEGGPASARAEDMDTASFLASLDPVLRHAVLLEQDEDMINQLPAAIAAEARALGAERGGFPHLRDIPRQPRHEHSNPRRPAAEPESSHKKAPRKQVVQMLDKAGIATLLRILFISHHGSSRDTLNAVLQNASQNRQNRAEILGIIMSVLQDGTTDTNSVEKSFNQLSIRAKQQGPQKTPQPLKRSLTGPQATMAINSDMTPLAVIQHCLNALTHLTEHVLQTPSFFLTEHESPTGLKTKTSKKGKGKDAQESKFPINALLSLLDRKIVMDSTSCLEQLSGLLQAVTHPLMILRHEKVSFVNEDSAKPAVEGQTSDEAAPPAPSEPSEGAAAAADLSEPAPTTEEAGPADPTADSKEDKTTEVAKKQRKYLPPYIPEHNLRLVVNIVSARECSGKTFRDTLSTINNLSIIPGAKETFGRELLNHSRTLADAIIYDLEFLIKQVQRADSNNEIHGVALSKFSPSSSDQAKLLRVLTALAYIFDPNRNQTKNGEEKATAPTPADNDSDGILASLYESQKFGLLWNQLSECLKAMRQRDSKTATAAILLPLIEALMVVCKNTALKEISTAPAKEFQVTSPGPDTTMEGLFFRFTEEHRKVLNDLVRQNPRLMSGTFSLLVKNPKVLEFDNKRNYFSRKLHARSDMRRPQPPLQLSVRRDQTFVDSYRTLYFKSADEIKYGKLSIRFHGEEGVDAGGVTREWFQTMSRQMFNPDYALFTPVASDRTTFHPNKDSYYNDDHLAYFKFIGRIIGKALYEGRALDCHFSRAVYKRILGKSVSIKDMETLDLDYYRSLVWMLENDISDIITETFSVQTDVFGASEVEDLIENGRNIPVTEENKQQYVQLVVEYRLTGSVKAQLDEFLRGFHEIVPAELIQIFNEQELELLISGLPDIDVDDWKNHTDYHNYSASSAQIQWFWRAVRSFDKEERAKLLQFVTGTAKVPLNGFKELEGMNGFSRFNIHRDYGNKQRLPSSHTCFNQLDLPEYDDYEALRQQLYTAMTAGSSYFGFA